MDKFHFPSISQTTLVSLLLPLWNQTSPPRACLSPLSFSLLSPLVIWAFSRLKIITFCRMLFSISKVKLSSKLRVFCFVFICMVGISMHPKLSIAILPDKSTLCPVFLILVTTRRFSWASLLEPPHLLAIPSCLLLPSHFTVSWLADHSFSFHLDDDQASYMALLFPFPPTQATPSSYKMPISDHISALLRVLRTSVSNK